MSDETRELSFEDALAKLEEIVQAMESGELSLEQSMARFEEGMTLSALCAERLAATEEKVEMLMKKANGELDWQEVTPPQEYE